MVLLLFLINFLNCRSVERIGESVINWRSCWRRDYEVIWVGFLLESVSEAMEMKGRGN